MVGSTVKQFKADHTQAGWLVRAAQHLDEHHLVAWSRNLALRERFGLELAWFLARMTQTQVVVIPGATIRDLDSFCEHLDYALPGNTPLARTIDGPCGVIDRLRHRSKESIIRGDAAIVKRRFYVWRDADVLLRFDPRLFGQIVDALCGVAAEAEYTSEDRLLIHRAVFIGGPALDLYAEDPTGQFRSWLADSRQQPLWRTVTGVTAPPMLRYALS